MSESICLKLTEATDELGKRIVRAEVVSSSRPTYVKVRPGDSLRLSQDDWELVAVLTFEEKR